MMREFAKVQPAFWVSEIGKALRALRAEVMLMSFYLKSSPHSNMLGLYYLPIVFAAHETGLGIEGASKALRGCIEAGFCAYDQEAEMVWVFEMAAQQVAESLSPLDKRCKGIQKDYEAVPTCTHLGPFFDRYQQAFNLTDRRSGSGTRQAEPEGAYQAPSKPLQSKEKEQQKKQKKENEEKPSRKRATAAVRHLSVDDLVAEGVDSNVAADWISVRRAKKAALTATALAGIKREAIKAGISLSEAIRIAAERGWAGFGASWLVDGSASANGGRAEGSGASLGERVRARMGLDMQTPSCNDDRTIDMEEVHASD